MKSTGLWSLAPLAAAVLVNLNTLPGDFVYDDEVLIEKGDELRDFDLRRIFLSNYWGPDHADRNYRPLALLTYALNFRLSGGPWSFHLVTLLLNAAAVWLAYRLLLELAGDAPAAAAGAAVYAVLPIHVEAAANVVGRAELLAALGLFGSWLLALRASASRASSSGREPAGLAAAASGALLLGLASKESAVAAVPLVAAGCLVLGRPLPWKTLAGSAAAVVLYLGVRAAVLEGKVSVISFPDNPLIEADPVTRALNALRLLGLYAWKTVVPVRLSADHSYAEIPVLPLSSPLLWAQGLLVAAGLALPVWILRRRAPLVALAAVTFALAFAVTANVLFPIGTIFAERLAYAPSFAYALLLCAALAAAARLRGGVLRPACALAACALVAAYGARTWTRNADWASRTALFLRMPADAPGSAQSHLKASEGWIALWREASSPRQKAELLEKAAAAARRSIEIYGASGKGEAKLAEVLHHQGRNAESVELLDRAIPAMTAYRQLDPIVLRLRGECRLRLRKPAEAFGDFDAYVEVLERLGARADPAGLNFRGLSLALQGKVQEALGDFDRALALRQDWPELWNNRAMARRGAGDLRGAIEDWRRGLELARALGNLRQPPDTSAFALLTKTADAWRALAAERRAAGDEPGAREAEAQAARCDEEAMGLAGGSGR
ncbi:MAG: hypothetical protein HY721_22350 [Planctomycetes bacterium]|nr:hypothetical protein [Planctomycetota bacterium]